MISKDVLLALIALTGILTGLVFSGVFLSDSGSSYCNSVEQQIKANQTFNGSVACYPPGVMDVNLSDRVSENTDHRCTCRIIDDSGVRIFPIAESN
jgi:hypothetical protein